MTECSQANRPLNFPNEKPLAMAYVPWQSFTDIYENLNEAFLNGTIFKKLTLPFYGAKGGCYKL